MTWTNPLDRVPQIRVDWANHIAQGGLGACLLAGFLLSAGLGAATSTLWAFYAMSALAVGKKGVDYVMEKGESWHVCLGKAIVTVLWPATLAAAAHVALR